VIAAAELMQRALDGDRRGLAQLLTLAEDAPLQAADAFGELHSRTGRACVLGITGAPGAGKSTLTNRLVRCVRARGETVAVIAVDPTSPFTGGALLGDRIRMGEHASDRGVYIRSMANRGHVGGVAAAVPQAVHVLDAVGYDWIVLETVGVGQVEVEIAGLADLTTVVVTPGWGDHVQVSKAGLLEIGDIFVVNKADRPGARTAVRDLRTELNLAPPGSPRPPIVLTEAHTGTGVEELESTLRALRDEFASSGELARRRRARLRDEIVRQATVLTQLHLAASVAPIEIERMLDRVSSGELAPSSAARELVRAPLPR